MTQPKNSLVEKKERFSDFLGKDSVKNMLQATLQNPNKVQSFATGIMSAVSANPALQNCDYSTILSSALLGETLGLSPSPQLGHYYIVPYEDNKNGRVVGTFQMGYKAYIQLAIRSGQYRKINVLAVKKGELVKYDPLNEEIDIKLIDDELERENAETTGYYAMFELLNGFRKTLYWSKEKMEKHAMRYSKGYKAQKGYTFWEKDFDGMAFKTMLRQLLSKWGILSVEIQKALEADMGVIKENGTVDYVDNNDIIDTVIEEKESLV